MTPPAGFPASTGDILTAAMYNGLISFGIDADATTDYTAVLDDQYQVLVPMNKATAVAFNIPTNASVAFPVGTAITILNKGAGLVTISAVTSGTTTVLSAGAIAAAPTLAQYKTAVCIKTATDTWYVAGGIA
jgi:ethanolamine ammonia-lyase large subunit